MNNKPKNYVLIRVLYPENTYYIVGDIQSNPFWSKDIDLHYYGTIKCALKHLNVDKFWDKVFFKQSYIIDTDDDLETIVKRNCTYFL